MSGFLLDTNVVLITVDGSKPLSSAVRKAVLDGPNYISVVSYWEVVLKCMKGNLDVGDSRTWWSDTLEELAARPLHLHAGHIESIYSLPAIHQDPFDRVLIAQARFEDLTIVTTNSILKRYSAPDLEVIL